MAVIDELLSYLETNGIGTSGTDLFKAVKPADVDNCVVLYDTGGPGPNTETPIHDLGIQIIVHNVSYGNGYTKAKSIFDLLDKATSFLTTPVSMCRAEHLPFHLGVDEEGKHQIGLDFTLTMKWS
jgi:hypothetical protein